MSLQVMDFVKTYGEKTAVDHLSFSMDSPGVFGLIGTNGAGKTTTIRMMLGILSSDNGTALWNGKRVSRESVRFGYMPEERGIYMKNKVKEQLVYFAMLRGMKAKDASEAADKWMERLGVSEYANMNAEKLSKGNQQKVQLISAVITDPDLIVLDEPFSGLDPVNTDIFRDCIKDMVKAGKYIVMSSHQMSVVEEYCENLVLLHNGKAVLQGSLRDIKRGYGRTNLIVSCEGDYRQIAENAKLAIIEERATETEYKIANEQAAQVFLKSLIDAGLYPTKFEIREPSLHRIFVEKAGENA